MKKIITGILFGFFLQISFVQASTSSQSLEVDASIKNSLNSLRAQAEIFYDKSNSYKDLCKDSSVKEILLNIKRDSGKTLKCISKQDNYAISSSLKSDRMVRYCVDSTGFFGSGVAISKNKISTCEQKSSALDKKLDSKSQKTKILKMINSMIRNSTLSFQDRVQLETEIRTLNDIKIVEQWNIFISSPDTETAEKNKDILISMLSGKKIKAPKTNSGSNSLSNTGVTKKDHFIGGNIKSKVQVVTYSSLEDSFSRKFDKTIRELSQTYGDQVAFVFRHNPLELLFNNANLAANAAECISKVGKEDYFSPYIYAIFKAQDKIENFEINKDTLTSLAQDFGVDEKKFNSCLMSLKYNNKVKTDFKKIEGTELSSGVPYSVVFGSENTKKIIAGAQTYEEVKRIIDSMLVK